MKPILTLVAAWLTALSLEAQLPVFSIAQGGSQLCAGALYDTGGPNFPYTNNENFTFVICPGQPSACISFTLDYYHLEPSLPDADPQGQGDQLFFFDGPDTNSPLLAALDGAGGSPENIAGGGGVCFQVQATSGCLTVQFKSDATVREEGWKGAWQCSSAACPPSNQVQVDTSLHAPEIETALSTSGAEVTVTSVNCTRGAMGLFHYPAGDNTVGISNGLILTSGQAHNAVGPNDETDAGSSNAPFGINDFGDPDLDYLSTVFGGGSKSADACVVEMDVKAYTDEVVFEYTFGSEEYPEFVFDKHAFNDIFAFLVSGPGITGDPNLTNNAQNIALLPNSTTPVQIDSVNNIVHWQYYRNNEIGRELQYDGLTSDYLGVKKSLTARVPVIPCNTYHLKLAIADRQDDRFDSGVFISEIRAGAPDISITFNSGVDYFAEGCTGSSDTLYFTLDQAPGATVEYVVTPGGSATFGVDYTSSVPDTVRFSAGQTRIGFPIIPVSDNIPEGEETIIFTISRDYGCGPVDLKTFSAKLLDQLEVNIDGPDTIVVCRGATVQLNATGADTYLWSPAPILNNATIPNPVATPVSSTWIKVTGDVAGCTGVDSVFVRVIAPTVDASVTGSAFICLGSSTQLQAFTNGPSVTWTPVSGLDDPNGFEPVATPTATVWYTASTILEGCPASDSVLVTVESLVIPDVIDDVTVCQNVPVQLANQVSGNNTTYSWEPQTGLDNPNISGPLATPDVTTKYIIRVNSEHEVCPEWRDSVTVTVIASNVEIQGPHYLRVCLGSPAFDLIANASPANATVTWSPTDYLSASTGNVVSCNPLESTGIKATVQVGSCPAVTDSIFIRVDSLPNQAIVADPSKPFYCPGDTVYLLSPNFVPGDSIHGGFPDIHYQWEQFGNMLWDIDKWQMLFVASDTNTYVRYIWNGACFDSSTILINVPDPPKLPYEVTPDTICPGQTVHIQIFPDPATTTIKWEPPSAMALGCDDCTDVFVMPVVSTSYTAKTPDALCPTSVTIDVVVLPAPPLDLNDNAVSCNQEPVQLNFTNDSNVTYTWTPAQFLNFDNVGDPTATPTQTGQFDYHVSAVYNNGFCTSEGDVTVFAYDASVKITPPGQNLCEGKTITLNVTTTGNPGTVTWIPGGPDVTLTQDTTITAEYHYGDMCVESDQVFINVVPLPELDLAPDTTVCQGLPVRLNTTNDPANVTYSWTPLNGLPTPTVGNPIATPLDTTTYTVVATSIVGGCTSTGSVTVNVAEADVQASADVSVCLSSPATLSATSSGAPGGTFSWSNGQTGASITVTPSTDQTYTVTYSVGPDCEDSDEVTVFVNNPMISNITGPIDSVCLGATVGLKVDILSLPGGELTWFADGVLIPGENQDTLTIKPVTDVEYTVMLTDDSGCTAVSDPIRINTKYCLEVPNAFTPNGDGSNDVFRPLLFGGEAEVLQFDVYSRWGEKVFSGNNDKREWDGKFDNKPAMSDVYVFVVRVRFANGEERKESGQVILLR